MTPEQIEKLMTAQREQYKLLKQILEIERSLDKKLEIIVSIPLSRSLSARYQ